MAPVIWGLDLAEIRPNKFKSSYMWGDRYHSRRTKFILYQLAMILCVVGESLITAALSGYIDLQNAIEAATNKQGSLYNNDIVGIGSFTIFCGVADATVFGAAFFFDLLWPERFEPIRIKLAWKYSAIVLVFFLFSDCVAQTVIVATRSAYITGVSDELVAQLISQFPSPPMKYKNSAKCIASCIFLWLGLVFTISSVYILWESYDHNDLKGPLSEHARVEEGGGGVVGREDKVGGGGPGTGPRGVGKEVSEGVGSGHRGGIVGNGEGVGV